MAKMKVFVSHSHSNNDFCAELVAGLKAAGADVWYDIENMHAGQLGPVIERELRQRGVFVVVLSPAALALRWVEDETRWAYGLLRRDPSRIILPVLAEALPDEGDLWLFLADFKRVEASGLRPFSPTEAVSRTLRALQLTLPGETPQPTAPQPTESAADLTARGKALLNQERYVEALQLFQRATQLDPNDADVWFNVGYTLDELKRYNEALVAYDRATQLDPNDAGVWSNKGIALNELKRYEQALMAFERALALDPNDAGAWYNYSHTLDDLKRYDEAVAAVDRALALDPNNALAWTNKSAALGKLQRYEEALAACDRALTLDPKDASAWIGKGGILRALGRVAEAQEAERRAHALGG